MEYSEFFIDKDFVKHREHIYYLLGTEKETKYGYIVASYSLKTKHLIIKDTDIIGYNNVLVDFINIMKEKENNNVFEKAVL